MKAELLIIAIAGLCLSACEKQASPKEGAKEKPASSAASAEPAKEHENELKVDAETQKRIGIESMNLQAMTLTPEVQAFGRVVNVSGLVSTVAEIETARAASQASQAELARLRNLAAQNNTSERALQAAEATAVRDQTQFQAAQLRLTADWGSTLASRQDLPQIVQALAALQSALVEVDVPAGVIAPNVVPTGVRLYALADKEHPQQATYFGIAPGVDAQFQSEGFFFLIATNLLHLGSGAALTGFIALPGDPQSGALLPEGAVVRHNGFTWVYLQTGDQTFERRQVNLDTPVSNGWFIRSQLKPGDKVVSAGAQQLLSQEVNRPEE